MLSAGLPALFVVFDPKYVVPQGPPLILHFRAKFGFSQDDFQINYARSGSKWFFVDGKAFSFSSKRYILDCWGNQVFMMQEKVALNNLLDNKQTVCHPDGRELFVVSSNFSNTKQTTSVTTHQGQLLEVNMRADFWGTG